MQASIIVYGEYAHMLQARKHNNINLWQNQNAVLGIVHTPSPTREGRRPT